MVAEDGFIVGEEHEEETSHAVTASYSPVTEPTTTTTTTTTPINPKVEQLLLLFPDSNAEIITLVLEHSGDNLELATETLLSMNETNPTPPSKVNEGASPAINQMDSDAAFARALAQEEDARSVRNRRSQQQQQSSNNYENNNYNSNNSNNLSYQPYTPKRSRNQSSNNNDDNLYEQRRGEEEPPRARDELDQLTEGIAKLAERGSIYAEQGKKTLGSFFNKVKEKINKFEEERNLNIFHDDGEASARPLPPPPASGIWTPPSSRNQPSASTTSSSNPLPHPPNDSDLPKLPNSPVSTEKTSAPSVPEGISSSSPSKATLASSSILTTESIAIRTIPTPTEEPKKDFSKIGLLPRQTVSLKDVSSRKDESEDEDDLEDYLDTTLHLSILSALASNLASTSKQDDLALLNSSFPSSSSVVTENGNGEVTSSSLFRLIDRLSDKEKVIDDFNQVLTTQNAYNILAFCQYTQDSPVASELNLLTIIELAKNLPTWEIEASLGLREQQDWSLPDQLAFKLVETCLLLTNLNFGSRNITLEAVKVLQEKVLSEIEVAAGHKIIGHLLPVLNGLKRAIYKSNFPWLSIDPTPLPLPLNTKFSNVTRAINEEWDSSTLEGRTSIACLDLYDNSTTTTTQSSLKGFSAGFVQNSVLELEAIYLAGVLSGRNQSDDDLDLDQIGWKALLKGKGVNENANTEGLNQDSLKQTLEMALHVWEETLISLEDDTSDSEPMDPYAFDILLQSLKLATLSSIAMGVTSPLLISILESLISEVSPVTDEDLQTIAVECLQVLARGFHVPALRNQIIKALRAFILSPCTVLEQDSDFSASKTLKAASKCYAACIQLLHDPSLQLSAIQSLLNHFTPSNEFESGGSSTKVLETPSFRSVSGHHSRSNTERNIISGNVAHAVSILVQEFDNRELIQITISMLLQRLGSSNSIVDSAVMVEVATLAQFVNVTTFIDIANALAAISNDIHSEDEMSKAVLTAQTCLASSAATRSELRNPFLISILSTFIKKGSRAPRAGGSKQEIAKDLLDLLPVIDHYFTSSQRPVESEIPTSVLSLFRNMWYLCVLAGFLSGPLKVTEWQRSILIRLAKESPELLRGVGNDFIETELGYNPILKGKDHILSNEVIKSELAMALPSQSGLIHSITVSQAIFLTTVLRVESLRAEAGYPSNMLSYFRVEGINSSILLGALVAIANAVNSTFIRHFSHSVTLHDIDPIVYKEVGKILLQCCDAYAQVRTISLTYLNDFISSFPSLICEATVLTTLLELLTVLRRACQAELLDEYTPVYSFKSTRIKLVLTLPDDYTIRNSILSDLHLHARKWIKSAISRAPYEMQGLLQDYIDGSSSARLDPHAAPALDDEMGKSVAVDLVRLLPASAKEASLPAWGGMKSDNSANFAKTFSLRNFYSGGATESSETRGEDLLIKLNILAEQIRTHHLHAKLPELRILLYQCAGHLVKSEKPNVEILHRIVSTPVAIFNEAVIALAQEVWTWIIDARPELESRVMMEVTEAWARTIQLKKGLFSTALNGLNPLDEETKFTPTDKSAMSNDYLIASRSLQPHSILLSFLSSRFQAFRYRDRDLVTSCHRLILRSTSAHKSWSSHPLARELRMRLLAFGFCVLQGSKLETTFEANLRNLLYEACLSWFTIRPGWSYGSNRIQIKADLSITEEMRATIQSDSASYNSVSTTFDIASSASLPGGIATSVAASIHKNRQELLGVLLANEIDRLLLWLNPMMEPSRGAVPTSKSTMTDMNWRRIVQIAWNLNPTVAVHLPERFKSFAVRAEVVRLVRSDPTRVEHCPEALTYFVGEAISREIQPHLRHLLYWAPVPVIAALPFLFPKYKNDPVLLQYALRVLEHHPVEVTFFYIPQVVQALRTDVLGYAERFIFETSKISQLFCHQIIWNMKANAYRGDAGEEADPMKPALDTMVSMIVASLSGEAKDFFEREFAFFDEVTSISAKLKPFIKASKLEKKAKIDEEMAKIKVDVGVYLPSNPDGVVVDIDRLSGRPLQSHAKAPFMATFKVRREHNSGKSGEVYSNEESMIETEEVNQNLSQLAGFDTWQSAIFKVGDDCRQDVLALQIIAMHKNIFTSLGLDLLVTPYRVTATGPGCGVIDVIPNATSRDEMGRAKVNSLKSFFVLKYGSPEGVEFQQARINFIQSMAAYSLLCHIVQIKDRHNGNIMIDGRGCITHIDFGFLFDIGPGGVKFEPSSFKLTHEMIVLMGGKDSVGFRQFSELTIKAFLACRPYGQAVVDTSSLMMAAEFPSFKGEPTMMRLKDRFKLDLEEHEAAAWMKGIIDNALENPRSIVYDEFQYITNSIPYRV